ncbi:MAG: Ig-like domain-containing protein [Lachnospiraceae bacterium]|nr:Ig-like domain-containing protein [Lachnospiraceae bacterium]
MNHLIKNNNRILIRFVFVCGLFALLAGGLKFCKSTNVAKAAKAKNKKIYLNKTKIKVVVGKTKYLKLVHAKGSVKWKSSKTEVAVVSKKGAVKGKKKGKCVISAHFYGNIYKCRVFVKKKPKSEDLTSDVTGKDKDEETKSDETKTTTAAAITPISVNPNALKEIHTGEATWYGDDNNNGYNNGCAGLTSLIQSECIDGDVTKPLYVCALSVPDFQSGLQGAYIHVVDKDGDALDCMVVDQLGSSAAQGNVDLDRKAFPVIEPLSTGRMNVSWNITAYPTTLPIQYMFKEGSTQYWAQIQVRNHRYPIVSLEYKNSNEADSSYKTLTKAYYNYYTMTNPGSGPFTFRVTDILGHVLTDTVTLTAAGTVIDGAKNFPE